MSVMMQAFTKPRPYRFTRDEFYQMVNLGWFESQPVEFMDGEIIEMPPQGPPHYVVIDKVAAVLQLVFAVGYWIRTQAPISLGVNGDPNPDVAVVRGTRQDYLTHHPAHAAQLVEATMTTLAYDRGDKASFYAKGNIADYWIVNIPDRQLEVYRNPQPDASQTYGAGYADVQILKPGDFVTPLAAPQARIAVADLLP